MDRHRRHLLSSLCLALALGSGLLGPAARAEVTGPPRIIDGDTLEVQGTVIHLKGIDAPELGQSCRIGARPYDCGQVARTALLDLTAGVTVTCKLAPAGPESGNPEDANPNDGGPNNGDPDGRVGRCTADGYDLSEGMAYTGWALALRRASDPYLAFEERARAAGRGLWKGRFVAPWDWRAGARLPQTGTQ